MTKATIIKRNNVISRIEITGHALSNKSGKDLVCAGISTVVLGICNALEELSDYDEEKITVADGFVTIPDISGDEKVQLICEVMITELKMIEKTYPKYIEISIKQEV